MRIFPNNVFDAAFEKAKSVRGPLKHRHGMYYNAHLQNVPVGKILEIGIGKKGEGLKAWHALYPHADIVGLDKDESKLKLRGLKWATLIAADPTTPGSAAAQVLRDAQKFNFDLIVDSNSKSVSEVTRTMRLLTPLLKPHGLYVVESTPDPEFMSRVVLAGLDIFTSVNRYKSFGETFTTCEERDANKNIVASFKYYSDMLIFQHTHEIPLRRD